jgi:hypothetical protein
LDQGEVEEERPVKKIVWEESRVKRRPESEEFLRSLLE